MHQQQPAATATASVVAVRSALKKASVVATDAPRRQPDAAAVPLATVAPPTVANDAAPKPTKRIRIEAVDLVQHVVVFHDCNPASCIGQKELVDLKAVEKADDEKLLRRRLQVAQLSADQTRLASNHQQAFSIFALPVVVDTKLLNVRELQAELRIRGLRTTGSKKLLAIRLDKYLLEHERNRCFEPPSS